MLVVVDHTIYADGNKALFFSMALAGTGEQRGEREIHNNRGHNNYYHKKCN